MAPLAASLAATAVAGAILGMGAVLARAELDRRERRMRRERERHLGLLPDEQPAQGLRRMALGQLDLAIELLSGDGAAVPSGEAVHETRKALKRLRALVRLLEGQLSNEAAAREHDVLRQAGRRLAGARDAEVMVLTLDDLLARHPRKLARRAGVIRLRARLVAERTRANRTALGDGRTAAEVVDDLHAARVRVAAWRLARADDMAALEPGLRRIYQRGRRRGEAAARSGKRKRGVTMHRWRKSVKDLRYAAEMLDGSAPPKRLTRGVAKGAKRSRRASEERAAGYTARVAQRADQLGELLGAEHDLLILGERVRADRRLRADGSAKALEQIIARRRKRLGREAVRLGARLFRLKPKRFLKRVSTAHALRPRAQK